jgi:sugar lactone lactonase YvrE
MPGTTVTGPKLLHPTLRLALGECPVWDARHNRLLVADIIGCAIHALSPEGALLETHHFPSEVGSFGLCRSGQWIVALRREVVKYEPGARRLVHFCTPGPLPAAARFNDGKTGPDGAFWVGSMDDRTPREPIGAFYRVAPDGSWRQVIDGLMVSNGLAWTIDGRTMVHTDSGGGWLDLWDFDAASGTASNRRRGFDFTDPAIGRPDGAAFDAADTYWSAGVRAGRINRFSRDGKLLGSDPYPNPGPTMPCFGGADLKTLYWSGLRHPLGPEMIAAAPDMGALYVMPAPVAGAPVHPFAD